ncbi:MAG: 2-phosphosulfolactate phosphatase [Planctomycetaceae bacterium]|nr:2-phosphosulfolactate phosphatase [Planctomycetaceae bacterium]
MPKSINVHFLPELIPEQLLAKKTFVVIDVLRATTTIAHALAAGAKSVVPCLEVADVRQRKGELAGEVVLGGERDGVKIEGFDFGNSPAEYTAESVGGKTLLFTTTNGTRAMKRASGAAQVLLAAFANFSAVCDRLSREQHIEVLCAGTNQEVAREDVLLAGAIVDDQHNSDSRISMNDQALLAADSWSRFRQDLADHETPLHETLRSSRGGRNLIEIGLERDIEIAAQIDTLYVVPKLDLGAWRITSA